jgi:hypothetical protein
MTSRQLKRRDFTRPRVFAGMRPAVAGGEQRPRCPGKLRHAREEISPLPPRPDATILSGSIPLFFIGRNRNGFWVAREAEGRSGGLFLLKRSAARFARTKSAPAGCATMFVTQPLELDIPNQGSRFVSPLAAAMNVVKSRAPKLTAFFGMAIAEWRKLIAQITRALAGERRNRDAIERELFRGQYTLASKNGDDLPIP